MKKYILTAVLSVSLFHFSFCSAFELDSAGKPILDTSSDTNWPVIVNSDHEKLGLFGGITSGYNVNGDLESAMLLVSSTGYLAPILNSGSIASLSKSYFQQKKCGGQEYLPATITLKGSSPYRGMVYHSLSSDNLVYIPKQSHTKTIKTRSRLTLVHGGQIVCDDLVEEVEVYEAIHNAPESTEIDASNSYDLATVIIEDARSAPDHESVSSAIRSQQIADQVNESSLIETVQEECSTGCLADALGNGVCDAECYVESCYYDKGDCDSLPQNELQMMLSRFCSPGCDRSEIGDGFCDASCNTDACQHDGGDCGQR
jgi:hypothetical protein